ncbi:T9SS type A sorting domain-containing protein [Flavobacterium sp. IMCC34852]|uniref:Aminopeptidase N n=1 Tax=Flavobacterium rivulicola TaxID=2732161 RepID=A0A7Y3R6Q7_9FLAO|nr:M1 family aminopeptidase [Flavobacterium sp. IMCC34852]NNT70841.1 T9SS type A sorting domain-containing protein [Flavobacterium sp. IMCC34852]
MKKYYFLLFYFTISLVFSQENVAEIVRIAESEMKSASQVMNFQVNPNTSNYDVTYHKLELTVNPSVYFIAGKVTTSFTALENMGTVTFDLANELAVTSVKQNTTNLSYTQNGNNELVVTLPATLTTGNSATLEIIYSGEPPQNAFEAFAINVHSGAAGMWTLSEPYGARDWWPCKQDLNDKISTIDVYITAPSQYVSVANGMEQSQVVNGNGTKTTHFHHGYPIPAYLIAFAVTNYQVYTQTAGTAPNTFPIVNYIYPESYTSAVSALAQTLPIMNFFETTFEPYPFRNEKYGHAQFGWGGGMEHTTVSFMGNFSRGLIAHELAHQWFGDKITCGTWKDIWLNEGFATYLSALVIEHLDGLAAFVTQKGGMVNFITSSPAGNLYLTDAQITDVGRIFNSRLSYNKGAMVLEMLRFKMGDVAFFQALRNYLADTNLAYDYAVTTDLKAHLETVYGQSLTEFFNDWVYNQGYPTYTITAQNWGSGQARFVVNQTQSDPSVTYFEMPVPVRVLGANGETADLVLDNTTNGQVFIMNVPFTITGVQFDPEVHLISKNSNITLGNETFVLENAVVLYPNPSSSELHIQMPDSLVLEKVLIYNSLGQKVLENNTLDLEVSHLSAGVHYVEIQTSEGTYHKKFIKK